MPRKLVCGRPRGRSIDIEREMALIANAIAMAVTLAYTEIVPTRSPLPGYAPAAPSWVQFPSPDVADVAAGGAGVLMLARSPEGLVGFFYQENASSRVTSVALDASIPWDSRSRFLVQHKSVVAVAMPMGLWSVQCAENATACNLKQETNQNYGAVHDTAVSQDVLWLATTSGLYRHEKGRNFSMPVLGGSIIGVAVAASGSFVVAGNSERIWDLRPNGSVVRWEWVTEEVKGWGGVVGPVSSLAFGETMALAPRSGSICVGAASASTEPCEPGEMLFVGTRLGELSTRDTSGAYRRIGRDQGLPVGNVTALLPSALNGVAQLWVGTTRGVALWEPSYDPPWRYLNGPRWLVGEAVRALASVDDQSIVVLTEGGVTWLVQEEWSLARKAAHYEGMLHARHDRHGMTSECNTAAFGAVEASCVMHDSDNNGLWTSLVVGAEYYRYRVTGEPEALSSGSRFFSGMVLLNEISGKRGLMARSACDPQEANVTCAVGGAGGEGRQWLPSPVPKYSGWLWKSDTSSDEVVGHIFALLAVAQLSPTPAERARAAELLVDIVGGLCMHEYNLIDVTGQPTTWGRWGPADVNGRRAWSDERGLQSLQILAFVAAALNVSSPAGAAAEAPWRAAYAQLVAEPNQYLENMLNLKITDPVDDNYSDDELALLPYLTLLVLACPAGSACVGSLRDAALASLQRTARILRPLRSSLWSAILLAADGHEHALGPASRPDGDLADLRWNLRNWPLELIEWPVANSHRIDIVYEEEGDRFARVHNEVIHSRPPLPANERRQYRWNANPYDVSDGGDGKAEGDPGAWLLPYWLGRAIGVLSTDE